MALHLAELVKDCWLACKIVAAVQLRLMHVHLLANQLQAAAASQACWLVCVLMQLPRAAAQLQHANQHLFANQLLQLVILVLKQLQAAAASQVFWLVCVLSLHPRRAAVQQLLVVLLQFANQHLHANQLR